jgi:hypothetical protein
MSNRKSYRLNDDALNAIRELRRRFREQTGRDPGPDDDYAFDPDSAEPQPAAEARIKSIMGDIADAAGLSPDLAFAIRKTGLLVTQRNKGTRIHWMMTNVPPGRMLSQNTRREGA